MAKQDNFDFDTESKPKFSLDLNFKFLEKFTDSQKKLLIGSAILVVAVILVALIIWIIAANGGFNSSNNGGIIGGEINQGGENDDNTETGGENGDNNNANIGTITNFSISSAPLKVVYYVGDEANWSGLTVLVRIEGIGSSHITYDDDPSAFTITGFDSTSPVDKQTIYVSYGDATDTFTIKVIKVPTVKPTLKSIQLVNAPTECPLMTLPDITETTIVPVFSDGTTGDPIYMGYEHLLNFEEDLIAAQVGDQVTIRVIYSEGGITVETTFTVTITE